MARAGSVQQRRNWWVLLHHTTPYLTSPHAPHAPHAPHTAEHHTAQHPAVWVLQRAAHTATAASPCFAHGPPPQASLLALLPPQAPATAGHAGCVVCTRGAAALCVVCCALSLTHPGPHGVHAAVPGAAACLPAASASRRLPSAHHFSPRLPQNGQNLAHTHTNP